jgi:hypothetical protein
MTSDDVIRKIRDPAKIYLPTTALVIIDYQPLLVNSLGVQ